uniref:Uncharacterized protein n=1 Tax=Anguilla anguilla TaxID=7936 RepID=A0A0E9WFQ6_ANGAN
MLGSCFVFFYIIIGPIHVKAFLCLGEPISSHNHKPHSSGEKLPLN